MYRHIHVFIYIIHMCIIHIHLSSQLHCWLHYIAKILCACSTCFICIVMCYTYIFKYRYVYANTCIICFRYTYIYIYLYMVSHTGMNKCIYYMYIFISIDTRSQLQCRLRYVSLHIFKICVFMKTCKHKYTYRHKCLNI